MIQIGHNSSSHNFLVVSNVEFYGELYEKIDIYKDEDEEDTLTTEYSNDNDTEEDMTDNGSGGKKKKNFRANQPPAKKSTKWTAEITK